MIKYGESVQSLRDHRIEDHIIGFGTVIWPNGTGPEEVYLVQRDARRSSSLGSAVVLRADIVVRVPTARDGSQVTV